MRSWVRGMTKYRNRYLQENRVEAMMRGDLMAVYANPTFRSLPNDLKHDWLSSLLTDYEIWFDIGEDLKMVFLNDIKKWEEEYKNVGDRQTDDDYSIQGSGSEQ